MLYPKRMSAQLVGKAMFGVASAIRGSVRPDRLAITSSLAVYMLYKAALVDKEVKYSDFVSGKVKTAANVKLLIPHLISEELWKKIRPLSEQFKSDVFAAALLNDESDEAVFASRDFTTPSTLSDLALSLLHVADGDAFVDLGCGDGNVLLALMRKEVNAQYYGYEISADCADIAAARLDVSEMKGHVQQCDFFVLPESSSKKMLPKVASRKVFSNFPFGVMLSTDSTPFLTELRDKCPALGHVGTSDWAYCELICRLMGEKGRGIGILLNGSISNASSASIRKWFLERGLIECVVALPGRLFETTAVSCTMVIFSHGNKSVRFVDAEKIHSVGRRRNMFSVKDIAKIVALVDKGGEGCCDVNVENLLEKTCLLNPAQYTESSEEDGVPFDDFIKKSTRGAPCTASDLDRMSSHTPTDIQYLMLANVKNGVVSDDLPYLNSLDRSLEKYCIKNNSLILSKNGYPYKVAVVTVPAGKKILANGNLFVLELDESKADPLYVKAYFESNRGTAALKRITSGSTIPTISIDLLRKVRIPLPSLSEQKAFVKRYQKKADAVAELRLRLDSAVAELGSMFDAEASA